jgi:predicted nucleotidyltransferase
VQPKLMQLMSLVRRGTGDSSSLYVMPKTGMIMPILGTTPVSGGSPADALFTKTQQRVLRVLFGQPERSFYASELIRDAGTGSGAAQRELARLEASGLVVARRIGNQKHYQANAVSPLFSELRNIVLKTVGLAEPLRDALKPVVSRIRAAFVYGSVARATDQASSDIDLMVVSDSLTYGDVFAALDGVGRNLGLHVNPAVYSAAEFSKRAKDENARCWSPKKEWSSTRAADRAACSCNRISSRSTATSSRSSARRAKTSRTGCAG